jgi:hypothetical protein
MAATSQQHRTGFRCSALVRAGIPALIFGLALSNLALLHAQAPYSTGFGRTSLFTYYTPQNSPAPKAPDVQSSPLMQPIIPILPTAQYLARKAEMAQYSRSSFPSGPVLELSSPVVPRAPAALAPVLPNPSFSWIGTTDTQFDPPSPDLAVGPSDVLLVVNSSIAQYTKSGTLKKLTTFTDWFATLLPTVCPSGTSATVCLLFDPCVRYDQLHGRFFFLATSRDFRQNLSYLLLSVSNGATYDSGWKIWAMDARLNGSTLTPNWADFWRLGFDNNAVYLSGNMFDPSSLAFQYAKMRVIKKADVFNTSLTSLPWQDMWAFQNEDGTTASSLVAAHQRGKPGINAGLFVNAADIIPPAISANFLTVWKVNDPLVSPLTVTRSTVKGLWSYSLPAAAPQLGGSATLDSGDTRVLKAIYRDGFLYTARDTGYADPATTSTFDVIDTTGTSMRIASQARLMNTNAFYPAFDVPASTPRGTQFASSSLITGTTTAADGSLTYAGISRLKAGVDYFQVVPVVNRWGDYFGGAVDPVTGGLWVSGQYAATRANNGTGRWGTWVGYFPWSTAQAFEDVPSSSFAFDFANILSMWGVSRGCSATPSLFCPESLLTRGQMAALIIRAMFGENFTYTTTPYFTDVPSTDPFFGYIQKLRDLGITRGCSATTFCPDAALPRADMAAFLIRAKLGGLFGDNFTYSTTPTFVDVPATVSQFPYVQKLYELGITSGCSPTQFCPNSLLTRQEAAAFLVRAFLN